jgi:hypothetical protein
MGWESSPIPSLAARFPSLLSLGVLHQALCGSPGLAYPLCEISLASRSCNAYLLRQLSGFDTKPTMVKPSAGLLGRDTFQSLLDAFYQGLETSRRRFA